MGEPEQTSTATDLVDVTNEPTLPGLELPDYHGRAPVGMKTSLNGAGNRLGTAHEIGERIVLVVEARVRKAGHEDTDDGLVYAETLKVADLFEVAGQAGKRLLSAVRQSYREEDDVRHGRQALPIDDGREIVTDPAGVVLTPGELAELRSDPATALADETLSPVVVVYSDAARELWPDDFPKGTARPAAGDLFVVDGPDGEDAEVWAAEILDAATGEKLEEWTSEQEEARLAALEADEDTIPAATVEDLDELDSVAGLVPLDPEAGPVDLGDPFAGLPGNPPVAVPPLPGEDDDYAAGLQPLEDAEVETDDVVVPGDFPVEPTPEDYLLVDREIPELVEFLADVTDLDEARRALEAEKRGRGRNLKTRKGAVDAILRRISEIEAGPA